MGKTARIASIVAGVAILAAAGLVVLGLSLNPNEFKNQIGQILKNTTSLTVVFNGDIHIRYFPVLGVELNKVALNAPDELGGGVLARVNTMVVNVKLLPIFSKRVETGTITLDGLEVHLVRDEQGRLNIPKSPVKEVKVVNDQVVITTNEDRVYSINYEIEGIKITKASMSLDDRQAHTKLNVANLGLSTGSVVRGKEFPVKLAFDYALDAPDAAGHVDLSGKATAIPELLRFSFINAGMKTTLAGPGLPFRAAAFEYGGDIRVDLTQQTFQGEKLKFAASAQGGLFPDAGADVAMAMNIAVDMAAGKADITDGVLNILGMEMQGRVQATGINAEPSLTGTLAVSEFNPRQTLARLGVKLPPMADSSALTKARLDAVFESSGNKASLKTQVCQVDATALSLDASLEKSHRPLLSFAMKADALDLDRYLPARSAPGPAALPAVSEPKGAETPMNIPLDATGSIEIGALKAAKLNFTKVSTRVVVKDNQVECNPFQLALYQGWAKGAMKADLGSSPGQPVQVSLNLAMDDVQVEPLLKDMQGHASLAGRASLTAVVTAKGLDPKHALASLGGKAGFALHNGAILGVNFSQEGLKSAEGLVSKGKSEGRTAIESARGTFTIERGVASGKDFQASVPPNRVTGQGWANLSTGILDYYVFAQVLEMPAIPVHLTGSISDPHISVDPAMLVKEGAKDAVETLVKTPQNVIKVPESIGKGALDAVGNMLGMPKKK